MNSPNKWCPCPLQVWGLTIKIHIENISYLIRAFYGLPLMLTLYKVVAVSRLGDVCSLILVTSSRETSSFRVEPENMLRRTWSVVTVIKLRAILHFHNLVMSCKNNSQALSMELLLDFFSYDLSVHFFKWLYIRFSVFYRLRNIKEQTSVK